jgi:SpoIID/LytB domain protein
MPVPSRLHHEVVRRGAAVLALMAALAAVHAAADYRVERRGFSPGVLAVGRDDAGADQPPPRLRRSAEASAKAEAPALQPPSGVGFFVRSLANPRERREVRPDMLDTPVLPGSVMKAVSLVTALEAGVITPESGAMCRRVVTVDGVRFTCAHPDLKRPLSPAEAMAHSCNDFFVSLARRLSREEVNRTRLAAGLPPLGPTAKLGPSLVGLDGPRVSPRALVDVMARLVGAGADPAVPMTEETRRVLVDGLRGAAEYGTAAAFKAQQQPALAKTGTAPMPGGGVMGLVVALAPPDRPTHGVVVVAPGGAGVDAAEIAAGVLSAALGREGPAARPADRAPATSSAAAAPTVIRLGRTLPDGRTRVEQLPVEEYVAQVVAGEGQPRAVDAAQQALGIAARTFALANRNRHRREGFDLCDTTHCQVLRPATETTRRAASDSAGRVLLHNGQPAFVFYSASCGGRLERASEVWPGALDYGTRSIEDPAHDGEADWQSEVRVGDVERALRAAGLKGSRLRDLRVLQRNASGRVVRLRADGFTPPDVSGHDFRMAMGRVGGWQLVKSTAFDVSRTGTGFRFRGRGFGHGVGLCVVGAGTRASRGTSADEILRFYFPDLTIGRIGGPDATATRTTDAAPVTPPAAPVPTAPARADAADVRLALPGGEEGHRQSLLALVRSARDGIARMAGVGAPSSIRVTVHPTVESFGRATGQPWWVSGATDAGAIDLLPVTILQQRGQLERTVRHEVAHAIVDAALAKRPLWVREGAAIYFADPPPSGSPAPPRMSCPSDAELLRPASAGAQRDAYVRAGACFTRQIAEGRSWTDVR